MKKNNTFTKTITFSNTFSTKAIATNGTYMHRYICLYSNKRKRERERGGEGGRESDTGHRLFIFAYELHIYMYRKRERSSAMWKILLAICG